MRQGITFVLLIVCVVLFVWGLAWIFQLRFEQGDIYPAYSTLRSDPLGLKGWFEGLQRMPQLTVRRNLQSLTRLDWDPQTALVLTGLSPRQGAPDSAYLKERLLDPVARGGRLILAFSPESRMDSWGQRGCASCGDPEGRKRAGCRDPNGICGDPNDRGIRTLLGNELNYNLERWGKDPNNAARAFRAPAAPAGLAPQMPWMGTFVVNDPNAVWTPWYTVDDRVVVMARAWAQGTVVVLTDSYLLSNEALVSQRQSALLAHLLGPCRRIVFDETHLGIQERAGIVTLARKYRLHGLMGGLFVLAVLLVWQRSVGLVVPDPDPQPDEIVVLGRDTGSGLTNLLKRSVNPATLLTVCLEEWCKSFLATAAQRSRYGPAADRARQRLQVAPGQTKNPTKSLALYQELTEILKQRENHE